MTISPIILRNFGANGDTRDPVFKNSGTPPLVSTLPGKRDGSRDSGGGGEPASGIAGSISPGIYGPLSLPKYEYQVDPLPKGSLIFETDFANHPDWEVQHAGQRYIYDGWTGHDGSSGYVAGNNIPQGFNYIYTSEEWHPNGDLNGNNAVPGSEPVAQINNRFGNMTDPNGKSWIHFDESTGGKGSWGADSVMSKDLGAEYTELYFECMQRFSPDWVWHSDPNITVTGDADTTGDGVANSDPGMKFLRCRRHSGLATENRFDFSGAPARSGSPVCIFDLQAWYFGGINLARVMAAIRGYSHPDTDNTADDYYAFKGQYDTSPKASVVDANGTSYDWADLVGTWIKWGLRVKMDSSPGAADGVVQVYVNDILCLERIDVPWREADDPDPIGWNEISLGGNLNNSPYATEDQFEQWYQVDSLKVYHGMPV